MGGGGNQKYFKLLVIVCTVQTFKCYMQDEIRTGLFLRGGTGVEGEGGGDQPKQRYRYCQHFLEVT